MNLKDQLKNIDEIERKRIMSLYENIDYTINIMEGGADENYISYQVKPGDSLSKLSVRYGVSVNTLAKINNITNINFIKIGDILKIPKINDKSEDDGTENSLIFKNKNEGDEFRQWVNTNLPNVAKKLKLDPSGPYNNQYIIKAWNYNLTLKNGKTIKLGEYFNLKKQKKIEDKKSTIEIFKDFNPEYKNQINFQKLDVNNTTSRLCNPNTNDCAQFINNISDDTEVVGDAWHAYSNNSLLGNDIYSKFKNLPTDITNKLIKLWQKMDKSSVKYNPISVLPDGVGGEIEVIMNNLVPINYDGPPLALGDYVGLYKPNSKSREKAFYEGGKPWFPNGNPGNSIKSGNAWGMNTHIGRVMVIKDNIPLILHNVGGNVKSDPPKNLRIAWVKRKKQ